MVESLGMSEKKFRIGFLAHGRITPRHMAASSQTQITHGINICNGKTHSQNF